MRVAKEKLAEGYSPSYPLQLFVFPDLLEQFIPDPRKHSSFYFSFLQSERKQPNVIFTPLSGLHRGE